MVLVNKIFFKVYVATEQAKILVGVMAVVNYPMRDMIEALEDTIDEGLSFIPTTLDTYLDYKFHQELGNVDNFKDIEAQNISVKICIMQKIQSPEKVLVDNS